SHAWIAAVSSVEPLQAAPKSFLRLKVTPLSVARLARAGDAAVPVPVVVRADPLPLDGVPSAPPFTTNEPDDPGAIAKDAATLVPRALQMVCTELVMRMEFATKDGRLPPPKLYVTPLTMNCSGRALAAPAAP